MLNYKNKTELTNRIILISLLFLVVEVIFFNPGIIFSILFSSLAIYIGRKKRYKMYGKTLFWFGSISLFITIITMMTVKFLLAVVLIYMIVNYKQAKENPTEIKPEFKEPSISEDEIIKRRPFFLNILFGRQQTPDHVYEWNDINIHAGIGDTVIDLSYTVLPKGESVIAIKKLIGNIQILVPYEVDVCVSHSVVNGTTVIFQNLEEETFNQNITYYTQNYDRTDQKVKIITSILLGDLEVKRI